jgi:hypothetical protein
VARIGDRRGTFEVCWEDPKEGDHLEYPVVDEKVILKWTCKKCDGEAGIGLLWLRIGTDGWLL